MNAMANQERRMNTDIQTATNSTEAARLRRVLTVFASLSSSVLAVVTSPNWGVAVLLIALIVALSILGLWVQRHILQQEQRTRECEEQHRLSQAAAQDLRDALNKRDIAVAVLYQHAHHLAGGKRRPMATLKEIIGDEMDDAVQKAQELLETGEDL